MKKYILIYLFILTALACQGQLLTIAGDSTNFEVNASWVAIDSNADNKWQKSVPQKTFFGTAYSAPYAIMTDTINPYPTNNISRFTVRYKIDSGEYVFPDAYIGFWHKYETDSLKDGEYIEISTDSGATWLNVVLDTLTLIRESVNFYTQYDTIIGNIPAFSGKQSDWQYSEFYFQWIAIMLPPINTSDPQRDDELKSNVWFRFNFKSDSLQTNKSGWIIDNIVVGVRELVGGVEEQLILNFDVKIFPNPIQEQAVIQVMPRNPNNKALYKINIYNMIGEKVEEAKLNNNQYAIKANNFNSGTYFYKICDDKGTFRAGKFFIK